MSIDDDEFDMPNEPASPGKWAIIGSTRQAEEDIADWDFVDDRAPVDQPETISPEAFAEGFGEDLRSTLDLASWRSGRDLGVEYARLTKLVSEAVRDETQWQRRIREDVFPQIGQGQNLPPCVGVWQAKVEEIQRVHAGLLFNGGVEAADGTHTAHDTLPLTVHQIGVSLVSYRGDEGTWHQRLFRRDLRQSTGEPLDVALQLLERRARRAALNHDEPRDSLGTLARQALMAYAERAVLLDRSTARWRMGHGTPVPWALLTGGGSIDLMVEATRLLHRLLCVHKRFVFVASEPRDRALLTIGQALPPLHYAIVDTLTANIQRTVEHGHYGGRVSVDMTWHDGTVIADPHAWVRRFRDEVGPEVVMGIYRAADIAPPHVFFAHRDHAHLAAQIAIADSLLCEDRGFPMLIDLADHVCRSVFGSKSLQAIAGDAYAAAGAPLRFFSERTTRR
jgi:hypothetical protein